MRERKKESIDRFFNLNPHIRWGLMAFIAIVFAVALYPSLVVKKHQYAIGDVVQSDVKASQDFFIEDESATETYRKQAVDSILTVYDLNPKILTSTVDGLNEAFSLMQAAYKSERQKIEKESRSFNDPEMANQPVPVEPTDVPDLPMVSLAERMRAKKKSF